MRTMDNPHRDEGFKLQTDFGVELEPEKGLVAVTLQVPPGLLRYLKNHTKLMGVW